MKQKSVYSEDAACVAVAAVSPSRNDGSLADAHSPAFGWRAHRAVTADDRWHLLYVKSRQEKALATELWAMRIGHYLPLVKEVKFHGHRKTKIETPLFPGYLFLFGNVDELYAADRTKRVSRLIPVNDQQHIDWELRNLELALRNGGALQAHAFLKKGKRVEVRSGPFRGLQGVVEDAQRPERIVLQVNMLARAVSMEIDGSLVDPID